MSVMFLAFCVYHSVITKLFTHLLNTYYHAQGRTLVRKELPVQRGRRTWPKIQEMSCS